MDSAAALPQAAPARKRARAEANTIFTLWEHSAHAALSGPPSSAIAVSYRDLEHGEFTAGPAPTPPHNVASRADVGNAAVAAALEELWRLNSLAPMAPLPRAPAQPLTSLAATQPPNSVLPATPALGTLQAGVRSLIEEHGLNAGVVAAVTGLRTGARALELWLAVSPASTTAAVAAAATRWVTARAAAAAAARERAAAATASLDRDVAAQYGETVAQAAVEAATAAARLESFSLPLSALSGPLAEHYAAEVARARAAAAAAPAGAEGAGGGGMAAEPSVVVWVPGADAAQLRRLDGGDLRRVDAAVAALLEDAARQAKWEAAGGGGGAAAAAAPPPPAAAAAAGAPSIDRWGQLRFRDGSATAWAPLAESPPLRSHGQDLLGSGGGGRGEGGALVARFIAQPPTDAPQPRTVLAGPGAAAVEAYLSRVVDELRAALREGVQTGLVPPARGGVVGVSPTPPATAADAVARVARALGAFATARVAESSSHFLGAVAVPQPPPALAAGEKRRGAVPPPLMATAALVRGRGAGWRRWGAEGGGIGANARLYPPGSERGAVLFGAIVDAAKATLRTAWWVRCGRGGLRCRCGSLPLLLSAAK